MIELKSVASRSLRVPDPFEFDSLSLRITCEGHSSPRWRGAHSKLEAAALNYGLSEHRARGVYDQVERMIKQQLPGMPIAVRKRAFGSSKPFPAAGEDNAGVDRSVVVMIDLITTRTSQQIVQNRPKKIWVKSTVWEFRVIDYINAGVIGFSASYMRVGIRNPFTKNELILAGPVFGGDLDISLDMIIKGVKGVKGNPFRFLDFKKVKDLNDRYKQISFAEKLTNRVRKGQIGDTVVFNTPPMNLDDWMGKDVWQPEGSGQRIMAIHGEIKTGLTKTYTDVVLFPNVETDLDVLPYNLNLLKFNMGSPGVEDRVESGTLMPQNNPQDYYMWQDPHWDVVNSQVIDDPYRDGILLSFPTGKSHWNDLGQRQCEDVRKFVMDWVQKVRIYAQYKKIKAPAEADPPPI